MKQALRDVLAEILREPVARSAAVSGGSINDAFLVTLASGLRVFVKTHASPPARMYESEARGLAWLARAGALRTPALITHREADARAPACLVLEAIESARPARDFDAQLGRGLAALHAHAAPSFGLDHDNYIALLPQRNAPSASWAEFYVQRRLQPQLALAEKLGRASTRMRRNLDTLCASMHERVGPAEPPATLHGDLWSGNLIVDERGAPCLIDPAAHGGHRELDLAMMRLFGGFSERVFDAYHEAHPLAPGHAQRVALYQLYFLLVHVNLFGGHYVQTVERSLDRLV